MIRFLLDDREECVEQLRADTTILEYLRVERGLTGTKEGCASGDCGACTVVLASADGDGLRYQPVNACIATVGSLHGKQLISVEALRDGEAWHPVQRAMIDHHGSQCGFCTPGFVMSLFALYHDNPAADDAAILEALGGNLCRCTGYRPIVDAARATLAGRRPDRFDARAAATLDRLRALADTQSDVIALDSGGTRYFRPSSREELAALLERHHDARLIAGGTDLMLDVTQQLAELPCVVDLGGVAELREIRVEAESLTLGAAVTHRDARAVILADYPELAELIERFGSLQIRSAGTVAGNVANASPIGDWPPVLLALGARLTLASSTGERIVEIDDFFTGYRKTLITPGEYLHSITLPRRASDLLLRAWKVSKRFEDDISTVCGVFALRLDGDRIAAARVAFGGMAAAPARAHGCEAALRGLRLGHDDLADAGSALDDDFAPIDDARASAAYRRLVARRLLTRLQAERAGHATRVREHEPSATATGTGHGSR